MKKLILAFLLTSSVALAEQKLIFFSILLDDSSVTEQSVVKEYLKLGWTIKSVSLGGGHSYFSGFRSNVAVLLEKN